MGCGERAERVRRAVGVMPYLNVGLTLAVLMGAWFGAEFCVRVGLVVWMKTFAVDALVALGNLVAVLLLGWGLVMSLCGPVWLMWRAKDSGLGGVVALGWTVVRVAVCAVTAVVMGAWLPGYVYLAWRLVVG
jgi:hypothetical protein